MLKGAMRELVTGNPDRLATDVGPVIDRDAREAIERHVAAMRSAGHAVYRLPLPQHLAAETFVAPTLIELDSINALEREVFGPVLHVVRFRARASRRIARRHSSDRLRADLRRAQPHRRDHRARDRRRARGQHLRQSQHHRRGGRACSPSAAKACREQGPRPAGRSTCAACWRAARRAAEADRSTPQETWRR